MSIFPADFFFIRFVNKAFKSIRNNEGNRKRRKILVFGDSNSLCSDKKRPDWPTIVHRETAFNIKIQNESCCGRTTWFDSGELNGLETFQKKMKHFSCFEYVIFMLGTNDIKKKYGPPSAEKISEGMRKIIDTAITANIGKAFVLISPPPMGTPRTDEFHPGCFIMDQVSYEYRKLAEKYDLTCIDLQRQLEVHRHLQKDTIHLNAEGRLQVAKIVQNTLFR